MEIKSGNCEICGKKLKGILKGGLHLRCYNQKWRSGEIVKIELATECQFCGKEFTESNPIYHKKNGLHKSCYEKWRRSEIKKNRPQDLKPERCLTCHKPFNPNNPHFSKGMHINCYRWNRDRMSGKNKSSYGKTEDWTEVIWDIKRHNKRGITNTELIKIENEKIEAVVMLNWFKEKMARTGGVADATDCFILTHLFEIYFPEISGKLDIEDVETQLGSMWMKIKTYEY